jgi:multiple sugar transport system ATP-binding protein
VLAIRSGLAANTAISVGVRPEHCDVVADPTADGIRGTVRHRENLGSDLFVHVETVGEHRIVARGAPEIADAVPPGAAVTLRPRADRALLFDRAGRRL